MSIFAPVVRVFRFFFPPQSAPKLVTARPRRPSLTQRQVEEARRQLEEKRAAREGGWDKTQYFEPD